MLQLDPVGTINSLKKVLFTEEGLATVTEWLTANWYIVAGSIVGFVILLVGELHLNYVTY